MSAFSTTDSRTEPHSSPPIATIDLAAERAEIGAEVDQAVRRVLESGQFILGPEVARFERDFAASQRATHGVGVASGTDAIALGLIALGVERGDQVLTSPFTFFASAGAIAWIGAEPRFVDVDPDTGLMDPGLAASAIEARTTCLLPVHLYGQLCDMLALRSLASRHGLLLLEDAAQAHGARREEVTAGQLGDAAAFSFYPTKNLGAAGDAGMVLVNNDEVDERLRRLRDHGSPTKYVHDDLGTNSRLPALQAAILAAKLPHLADWNRRRAAVAARYEEMLHDCEEVRPLAVAHLSEPCWHQYTVRLRGRRSRDEVIERLRERGVGSGVHYPRPVHLQRAAARWGYRTGAFPHAEQLAKEVLCLPIHPWLRPEDAERVASLVMQFSG